MIETITAKVKSDSLAAAAFAAKERVSESRSPRRDIAAGLRALPVGPNLPMYASVATPERHSIAQSRLWPDILAAKARVTEMRERLKKPVDHPTSEPSNADLMSVILGMRDMMALKEDVQVAKLETVQEIRTELVRSENTLQMWRPRLTEPLKIQKELYKRQSNYTIGLRRLKPVVRAQWWKLV